VGYLVESSSKKSMYVTPPQLIDCETYALLQIQ